MSQTPPGRPVTSPRPSRGARWGIGLAVAGVLALVGVVGGAVAIGQALGTGRECVSDPGAPAAFCPDDSLTGRTGARVLRSEPNTDPFGISDPQAPGWLLDLTFRTQAGRSVEAYGVDWPDDGGQPEVDSFVIVAYDPDDPEYSVVSAKVLDAAQAGAEPAEASAAALWTTGLGFAAALAALVATVVWARRAPRRERPAPAGWYAPGYGYPPPGYGYPPPGYGYPQAAYPQQGYPQQAYPPVHGPPPGYGPPTTPPVTPPVTPPAAAPPAAPPPSGPPVTPPVTPPQPGGWNAPG